MVKKNDPEKPVVSVMQKTFTKGRTDSYKNKCVNFWLVSLETKPHRPDSTAAL